MKQSLLPLALAGALSGLACGPTSAAIEEGAPALEASRDDAIIGGVLANGDLATVALAIRYGGTYESVCTGTLIAPKTVLTAAHCIYAYGQQAPYYVTIGTYAATPVKAVQVAQQYRHPSYNQSAWDFGLLRLATPILDVPPIPINETPMTQSLIGRPIRHVGFGLTVAGGQTSGTKREVTYNLRQITAYTIESGASGKQTCQGDSGGPGFMVMPGDTKERLVGVVSYGDQDCMYQGYDGRVDVAASWIRSTMAGWEQPTCATDGACVMGCTPIDQDCVCKADGVCSPDCADPAMDADCPRDCAANGVCATQACGRPDADCINEGLLCDAPTQCRGRLCVSDQQNPETYCTKNCTTSSDCPSTMECAVGACRIKQKPARQPLDTCFSGTDFCTGTAMVCTGPASGDFSRCVKSCQSNTDCPSGNVCESGFNSTRYCRPPNLTWSNIKLPSVPSVTGDVAPGCTATGSLALWLGLALLARRRRS